MNQYLQVSKQITRKDPDSSEPNRKSELNTALGSSQINFNIHRASAPCITLCSTSQEVLRGIETPSFFQSTYNLTNEHKLDIRKCQIINFFKLQISMINVMPQCSAISNQIQHIRVIEVPVDMLKGLNHHWKPKHSSPSGPCGWDWPLWRGCAGSQCK